MRRWKNLYFDVTFGMLHHYDI